MSELQERDPAFPVNDPYEEAWNSMTTVPYGEWNGTYKPKPKAKPKSKPATVTPAPTPVPRQTVETPTTPPEYAVPEGFGDTAKQQQQPSQDTATEQSGQSLDETRVNPEQVGPEPQLDTHRSLLQAMMGWDDVPYGMKWNHFLQHVGPGHSRSMPSVLQAAQIEKMGGNTYGQELRAKEQRRRTLMGEWDKLLGDWNAGRYSGNDTTVAQFYNEAERLMGAIANEGIDTNTLRKPSINAGGFAQGSQKVLDNESDRLNHMGEWMTDIMNKFAENPGYWNNHQYMTAAFDKLGEYVILNWAQSKGSIADAEKKRGAVEVMDQPQRNLYDNFISGFFSANFKNALTGLQSKLGYSALKSVEDYENYLAAQPNRIGKLNPNTGLREMTPEARGKERNMLNLVMQAVDQYRSGGGENIPIEVSAAINAAKNSLDAFDEYMMKNASVDRETVWEIAMQQYNSLQADYKRRLGRYGKSFGWDADFAKPDPNFGKVLKEWQKQIPVNQVLANAAIASVNLPQPTNDPKYARTGHGGQGTLGKAKNNGKQRRKY